MALELMGRQIALLDALRKLDRPIVVLVQGKPSTLPARVHRAERAAAGPLPTRAGGSTATGAPI
jgi:hypothetical protein